MKDSSIIKLSLITTLAGILSLILLCQSEKPLIIQPNEINLTHEGLYVQTQGKITGLTQKSTLNIITLNNKLNAVSFDENNLNLSKNQLVIITGKVQIYQNKPQILIRRLET